MTWTGFTIDGNFYDLSHLQSSEHYVMVDGQEVKLHVSYSNHCFTDQKENGAMLFKKEQRYWCHERYARSKELPNLIQNNLIEHYAVPYLSKKGESYHYMEAYDYAIFFSLTKPHGTIGELKMKVNSAYELDEWGRDTLPKGKPKRVSWILSQRLQGKSILNRKR
ncbi:hypothetical protein J8B38_20765 [Vibrio parahaemolyticus]|uniref:hypothetical protein n=1 Tax=Vibrio harveyi group TaxID=717610 RepID=UPI0004506465|nr:MULTISPECIES: hypothetical protein [Vibrio harveyi group]EIA1624682.1 hypothetical protein [Vibrio parahaemolyticus]EIV8636002.1 hypothetical protein [Vibrio parahaemolyticus]EIZ1449507.1 hypothetical protein [Vibrio parahaemolyticus]EJF4459614.1 hypothetical protein [Vibrio parahaemolyticus]EKB1972500.1 hypothetical protein [Vibrio parahaemolyticus]